jgi:hypothetical protein
MIGPVTDEQIKGTLNGLPKSRWGPGKLAVLHSRVEGAGCDLDEFRRWVEENGGSDGNIEAIVDPGLKAGDMIAPPPRREPCFVIPEEALGY